MHEYLGGIKLLQVSWQHVPKLTSPSQTDVQYCPLLSAGGLRLLYIPCLQPIPCSVCVWMAPPHCQPVSDGCFPYEPGSGQRIGPGRLGDVKLLTRPVNLCCPVSAADLLTAMRAAMRRERRHSKDLFSHM